MNTIPTLERCLRSLVAASLLGPLLAPAVLSAQDLRPIGSFDNVRASASEEPHCDGYSLALWQYRGRLIGLFDVQAGLCGDPPCGTLADVTYRRGTGELSFSVKTRRTVISRERIDVVTMPFAFQGALRRDDVVGRVNGRRVRLVREARASVLDSDTSLARWCEMWRSVGRCSGVRELCVSLGQP